MAEGVRYTGIPTWEELRNSPGFPNEERLKKGRVAVIECVQEIPCNPCEDACSVGAISVGSPITNLPVLDADKCTGCGKCLARCPGLAIFLINYQYSETEAVVSFPFEYWPFPKEGDVVDAVDRGGRIVCKSAVTSVRMPASFNNTCIVSIAVPKEHFLQVRSMKLLRQEEKPDVPEKEREPSQLICRCEELAREDIDRAINEGATTIDGVKRATRAGMGLCQGKSCERLVARILSERTGKPLSELLPATHRAPVRPVRMGIIAGECEGLVAKTLSDRT